MGTVVSDKMDKTVVVSVERVIRHPCTARRCQTVKFKAHDENNECSIGIGCALWRPGLSKDKRWRVMEIVEKAR